MARTTLLLVLALGTGALFTTAVTSPQDEDLAAVMRVVQRAAESPPPKSPPQTGNAQNLRIVLKDKDDGAELKFCLPLRVIEWLLWDEDATLDELAGHSGVKVKDVWKKLKELGKMELLEIESREGLIRIWID